MSLREPPSTLPIDPEATIPAGQHVLDVEREDGVYATLHMRSAYRPDIVLGIEHVKRYKVGRASAADLVLSDARVSSTHFSLHTVCSINVSETTDKLCFLTDQSSNGTYIRYARLAAGTPGRKRLVGYGNCVLLSDGDDIEIRQVATFTFKQHYQFPEIAAHLLTQLKEERHGTDGWILSNRLLGSGSFGHVLMAHNAKTGHQVCCKVLKRSSRPQHLLALERELEVVQGLSHPNVITTYKVAHSAHFHYIYCEMLCGGDCFSYWHADTTDKSEVMVAFFVYQVLFALEYLHSHGIAHRDLKLENVLMAHAKDGCRVVLTDFGLARRVPDANEAGRTRMQSIVGNVNAIAPEILEAQPSWCQRAGVNRRSGYGVEVDLWSLGVLIHEILLDYSPFSLARDMCPATHRHILTQPLDFAPRVPGAPTLSAHAKSFLRALLEPDPLARMMVSEARMHPWLARHTRVFEEQYQHMLFTIADKSSLAGAGQVALPKRVFQTPAPKRLKLTPGIVTESSDGVPEEGGGSSPCKRLARMGKAVTQTKRRILIELDANGQALR